MNEFLSRTLDSRITPNDFSRSGVKPKTPKEEYKPQSKILKKLQNVKIKKLCEPAPATEYEEEFPRFNEGFSGTYFVISESILKKYRPEKE